jgi:biotin carboxylase
MNKSLLIIGAGFGQVPAIRKAKELGVTTICVDKNPNALGMAEADFSYEMDVVDFEGCLKICKKHSVNGVMTMQSDLPVPTVGYINDALKLIGVDQKTAMACSNKILMRKILEEHNCEQPRFKIIETLDEAVKAAEEIGMPCVIKAPDSSGSRGVTKVNFSSEIEAALREAFLYSRDKSIIVEEYISGLEFGAQTFSENGVCKLVLMHNDTLSDPPYMIPIGHSFPFKHLNESERKLAEEDIKKAVLSLGINDGPANVDLILNSITNRVKVIEIGARIGATCLPELVYHYTGKDWVELTIKNVLGEPIDLNFDQNNPVAALILQSPNDGRFVDIELPSNQEYLIEFEVTVKKDDAVSKLRKGTDRIGKVLCSGVTVEDAEQNATNFYNGVNLIIDAE